MSATPSTTTLHTVGEIARRLGESLHRIEYVIRSRNIQPSSRAGHIRIFTEGDVAHIADELRLIDADAQVTVQSLDRLHSIFRYPGGKSKSLIPKWIHSHRPSDVREYREPFVGGGGAFFALDPSTVERRWINDRHPGLIEVYKALHDRPDEFIALCRSIPPAQAGEELTAPGPRGSARYPKRLKDVFAYLRMNEECDQALRYFFVNRTVFGGRVNYDIPSRLYFSNPAGWNIVATDRLEVAAQHIQGTKVTCGDYARLFTAPGDGVWIYADPPYVINNTMKPTSQLYQYVFTLEDHRRLAEVVKACPHKVAISYDDDPDGFVRSLYPASEGFHIVENHWLYCGSTRKQKATGQELLILKDYAPAKISGLCG